MNPKNEYLMKQLKELAFKNKASKQHFKKVIAPLLKQEGILGFPEYFQKLLEALNPLFKDLEFYTLAIVLLKDLQRVSQLSPMQVRFEAILEHPWNSEKYKYVQTTVKPLLEKHNQIGLREYNHQLEAALKPLKSASRRLKAIPELLKHIGVHNKVLSQKLKVENKALYAKQAMLRKPFEFDSTNGLETYKAFVSMIKDAREMRQILDRRMHLVKGQEYKANLAHWYYWRDLEKDLVDYLENYKNMMISHPQAAFRNLNEFLTTRILPMGKEGKTILKTDFAALQKFVASRVGAITKAKNFQAASHIDLNSTGKIDFEKRRHDLPTHRQRFDDQFIRFKIAQNDPLADLVHKVMKAYDKQLQTFQVGYDLLRKQPPSESNSKAIYHIEQNLKRTEQLIRNIYFAFEKNESLGAAEDTLHRVLTAYCNQDPQHFKFNVGHLKQPDVLYTIAAKFADHISRKAMQPDPVIDKVYGKIPVQYEILHTNEQRQQSGLKERRQYQFGAVKEPTPPRTKSPQFAGLFKPGKAKVGKSVEAKPLLNVKDNHAATEPAKKTYFFTRSRAKPNKSFSHIQPVYGSIAQIEKTRGRKK